MAVRTSPDLVIAVLGNDYGPKDDGTLPDLTPYIRAASSVIDRAVTISQSRTFPVTDGGRDSQAELMERWLAAHFYTKSDPTYMSRSTGGRSGQFIRSQDQPEPYRDGAELLDPGNTLRAMLKGAVAGGAYVGTPPDSQVTNASNL